MRATTMMVLAIVVVCGVGASVSAQPFFEPDGRHPGVEKMKDVRDEISVLNLLNGLYLSGDQVDSLLGLAERAAKIHDEFRSGVEAESSRCNATLSSLRDALYAPGGSIREQQRDARLVVKRVEHEPKGEMMEELGAIEDEARTVLSDAQVAIIDDFKPCLVPPKKLSDPVAVGQASTTERQDRILRRVRRMGERRYANERESIAERIVRQGEREKGKMPEDVRRGMVAAYVKKLDHARGLSDVDFELTARDLAESFRLFDDDKTYAHGRTRRVGKISRFLLNARGADVLARWRAARADVRASYSQPTVESARAE